MQKWHIDGSPYGLPSSEENPVHWSVDDVVGCLINIVLTASQEFQISMTFSLNNANFGSAFVFPSESSAIFPAISLNGTEDVVVNLGQLPFAHAPSNAVSLASVYSGVRHQSSVSSSEVEVNQEVSASQPASVTSVLQRDVGACDSVEELETLGLEVLKQELDKRGLKTGGTLSERATRLHAVRGLSWEQIDIKHKQKNKISK
jgi:hypothetical protein